MGTEVDHGAVIRRYEIGFDGDVAAEVLRVDPEAHVTMVPTCTVLWSWSKGRHDLDTLLDALLDMGITPQAVYESPPGTEPPAGHRTHDPDRANDLTAAPAVYCEVRIGGRLGEPTLRHLRWSHRVVKTTVVELLASPALLWSALTRLSAVSRVEYVRTLSLA